ncbi:Uncharacterised protein [Mycobacterium tuberculosis]|nr:Uncharacterised protein [Mycobacterium tuberculosis]
MYSTCPAKVSEWMSELPFMIHLLLASTVVKVFCSMPVMVLFEVRLTFAMLAASEIILPVATMFAVVN